MKNKLVRTQELFECENELIKSLFDNYEYPWEILPEIKSFIKNVENNYRTKIGYNPEFYVVEIGEGPKVL